MPIARQRPGFVESRRAVRFSYGTPVVFRYKTYNVDPSPFCWILKQDDKAIEGINLHYLPQLRLGYDAETYRSMPQKTWIRIFNNLLRLGYFSNLIDDLKQIKESVNSERAQEAAYRYLKNRYPWAIRGWRRYLKIYIRYPRIYDI